ncbi:unnamed protein product [Timema podura]|uniref:Uncharacterized protein n=1 Tax=Timema podura TaxID=61482 RepID=A0ABN7PBA2_TIMPD|nr:unnamed protein product [Timema podura]
MTFTGCDVVFSVTVLTLSFTTVGAFTSGYFQTPLDIAPNFAGSLTGMMNAVGSLTGIISPPLAGAVLNNLYLKWVRLAVLSFTTLVGSDGSTASLLAALAPQLWLAALTPPPFLAVMVPQPLSWQHWALLPWIIYAKERVEVEGWVWAAPGSQLPVQAFEKGAAQGWRVIFLIAAFMYFLCSLPYLVFATARIEPWNGVAVALDDKLGQVSMIQSGDFNAKTDDEPERS